ncbi:phage tail sheath family protein [Paenibacillus chitinolyticus]|uniref:Phage tail sheath family protein n=1 Tax=Paenibacillus chitinolyticus TaxID=79263 RepID=A0A410WW30_9BACL|nr:phage tail sheath C-terminal domain-containing protein [Paenibacillus chitinolyticus]MCY9589216.1 phage tail sheath family protein [Paenibacillus chitinolyticus]MCY9594289.1 phage tail sheath family protein [Paenibacillus chitinolyticus]QAV18457.1 phage tail sheath family protein [Paenibacillus chitinolyticus]
MSERHGIYTSEVPFSVMTPVSPQATIPVVFGTAPVHLSKLAAAPVNTPILCKSWDEAVDAFGYSEDWESYTLSEFMYSHFRLYKQAPVVLINVLDPAAHKTSAAPSEAVVTAGMAVVSAEGILPSSVTVQSADGATTYSKEKDYTLAFDKKGRLMLSVVKGGAISPAATALKVGYDKLDRSKVTAADLIGGTDAATGEVTGLDLIKQVFPRFQLVPTLVLAPGFSHDPQVASVLAAKAESINGHFKAMALTDLPADRPFTDLAVFKKENGYASERQIAAYPNVTKDGRTYRFSTHLAGVMCRTDLESDGVPHRSPSNKLLQADGTVLDNGTELPLGPDEAEYLNNQGIFTALNFVGGWKTWGNRTAAFPEITDPQNAFIPVRRMFDWIQNSVILTYWKHVDDPANKRLVESVTDSLNIWMNGLQASGYILGGRVEFIKEENPATDLMNGKLKFHIFVTPPSPAQEIQFKIEYDAQYLGAIQS